MHSSYKAFDREGGTSAGGYVVRVILIGIPKLVIIGFSIVIAAYTAELVGTQADPIVRSTVICFGNQYKESAHRVCKNGIAAAISSILVCMMLLMFDVFIPCLDKMFKRLAHLFSLLFSIIMSVYLLVTSALLANLYTSFCDEESEECGDDERNFLVLPLFGFLTLIGWGIVGLFSCVLLIIGA
ncbi:uncharacterized protein [Dysidea avara]|uniref:uncharacterized protein n=1 Tax=Dysidea avara TaxID=196820 RepID=UPI00331C4C0F